MSLFRHHKILETSGILLSIGILITVSIGGLVQIVPLFTLENTIERVEGVRPYTPLELAGRNIYVREGCYNCHSQMIRPFRDEVERYGHWSLAAESMYDRPFQWASKRTGPDLARVGGKYSDEWHVRHLINPREVVPESIMPGYPHLARREIDGSDMAAHLQALKALGVPYDDEMVANARKDFEAQASGEGEVSSGYRKFAHANPRIGDFDGDGSRVTEMDALVAYLQMLGTTVDFRAFDPVKANAIR